MAAEASAAAAASANEAAERVRELVAADWAWQLEDSPEYATLIGQASPAAARRLDDLSLAAFGARREYFAGLAAELRAIDAVGLAAEDRLNHTILLDQAQTWLDGFAFGGCECAPPAPGGTPRGLAEAAEGLTGARRRRFVQTSGR